MLEDLKVKNGYKERHGPSAHYTAAGDEGSSDEETEEHPVKALAVYGVPSTHADAEDSGFESYTKVSRRNHDELQRRIYEAQRPQPSEPKQVQESIQLAG